MIASIGVMMLLLAAGGAPAQAQESPLEAYVRLGLERNPTLRRLHYDTRAGEEAVREARGAYLPSLGVEARYTRAGGGRTIDLPLGDLLNPAYEALSELTGAPGAFPTLENQQIRFLREREQETRLRLVQPVFRPAIGHRVAVERHRAGTLAAEEAATRRRLVAEIKLAYFDYLRAGRVEAIYAATLDLVRENLRVNERLAAAGKATHDVVFRAQAEVSAVEQQLAEARTRRALAAAAFNTLLDRPLDAPIETMDVEALLPAVTARVPDPALLEDPASPYRAALETRALGAREELTGLAEARAAADAGVRLARTAYLPDVALVLDYGIQGTTYRLSGDSDFRSASLVLRWNLFDGRQKRARVARARLHRQALDAREADARNRIRLEVRQAADRVAVAHRSLRTAEDRLAAARQTFRLVRRRYEEGMAAPIDLIDARTALTSAELNLTLTRYELLMRHAELERAAALE